MRELYPIDKDKILNQIKIFSILNSHLCAAAAAQENILYPWRITNIKKKIKY